MSVLADEHMALRAMRARRVDDAESLLEFADPAAILAACDWWDAKQPGAATPLLVWKIKRGGVSPNDEPQPTKGDQLRASFAEKAKLFPPCSVVETHASLSARKWPDDESCQGQMVVLAAEYPMVEAVCDACRFEVAYPHKSLPRIPAAVGAHVPDPLPGPQGNWPKSFDPAGRVQQRHQPQEANA